MGAYAQDAQQAAADAAKAMEEAPAAPAKVEKPKYWEEALKTNVTLGHTSLTNWDTDSYGSQADDNPVDCSLDANNSYAGPMVKGKGSFSFPDWPGGLMSIRVDMNTMNLSIAPAN